MANNAQQARNKKYDGNVPHSEDWPTGRGTTPTVVLPRAIEKQGRADDAQNPFGGTRKQIDPYKR